MGVALQSHTKINICCKRISWKLKTVLRALCYMQGWLILRKIRYLNFTFTIQLFFLFIWLMKIELTKSVPKHRHIKFRYRRITHKKEYNIQHIRDIGRHVTVYLHKWYGFLYPFLQFLCHILCIFKNNPTILLRLKYLEWGEGGGTQWKNFIKHGHEA